MKNMLRLLGILKSRSCMRSAVLLGTVGVVVRSGGRFGGWGKVRVWFLGRRVAIFFTFGGLTFL